MIKNFWIFITFLVFSSTVFADDMRFVQISDARFSADNEVNILSEAIKDINKQKNVEFVVFTGDNLSKPAKKDLEEFLKETKQLKCPFYVVLGEHDVNKHKDLSKAQYFHLIRKSTGKCKQSTPNYIFEKHNLVFILLDGSKDVIPSTNGFYKSETLDWLDVQLSANQDKKVFIFQHFPIVAPSKKENYYTYKPEVYLTLLKKHNNVQAIFAGHFGINKEEKVNGITHVSTSGLPTYKIIDILDYETDNPTIWSTLKEVK